MAVVKAEAYGHGGIEVSKAAIKAGADRIGVALIEEGIKLRKAGINIPIQILTEPSPDGVSELIQYDLIPTICSEHFLDELVKQVENKKKEVKVHLKVDTGMNRIGVHPRDIIGFIDKILSFQNIVLEGIFTHLAAADKPEWDLTDQQLDLFNQVISNVRDKNFTVSLYHAANSAGILYFPRSHYDLVRPGIALYGLAPSAKIGLPQGLKPVLSWKSKISFIKDVPPGQGVSYNHTFITSRKTKVATVPLGYADGFTRLLSNRGEVLIKGKRRKIVGNVCMDQFMVDLGNDEANIGDEVVLIGQQDSESISAEEMAELIGTINYEVTTRISERVPRVYINK